MSCTIQQDWLDYSGKYRIGFGLVWLARLAILVGMRPATVRSKAAFPASGWAGLALVAICWALNWGLEGLRTHLLFFPQWVGYCLVVDGLTRRRKGSSLLTRDPRGYGLFFLLSIPVWWLFEGLNHITRNWSYLGREQFSNLEYVLLASLSFSTVIPAVFSTAELLGTFTKIGQCRLYRGINWGPGTFWLLHGSGWLMLLFLFLYPSLFFPCLWLSLFFIVDPLNALRGRPSLFADLCTGNLSSQLAYGLGALVCGFFWELWNVYSFPKWIYQIPYLDYFRIFEMPLAGYGGYIPFGWELFALCSLVKPLHSR